MRVGAPPSAVRANEAVLTLIAKEFGLSADEVSITSGETSRSKRVALGELDLETAGKQLDRIFADKFRR